MQDQRIRILTDAPVNQNGIGYKVNEKHAANQKGKKFSVGSENIQSVGGYGVKYQTEDSEGCQVDDPADYQGCSVSNVSKDFFCGVICCTKGKTKKDGPGKDTYIVCIHQGRYRVGNNIQKKVAEDLHNTLWGTGVCGCIGKCQLYRENHAGENVKGNYCFDNAAMGFSCVAQ